MLLESADGSAWLVGCEETMNQTKKIILAITGATGMLYVVELLGLLQQQSIEVHAIISDSGCKVLDLELGKKTAELQGVSHWFAIGDFTAPMASGSCRYDAMIVLPCTVGTLGAVAAGFSGNLIHRAADVSLKERRPLLLAVRETPFNRTHIVNMMTVHDAGAIICPPMGSFYNKPKDLQEMARNFAARVCDQIGIETTGLKRWEGIEDAG